MTTQEISLKLEHYDDIFSDFDMRPYSKRALSVDFVDEIRRASLDKSESGIDLSISVPADARSESHEVTIKERLAGHFEKHYGLVLKEKRKTMGQGVLMVVLGVISMILATFILSGSAEGDMLKSFLVVFLEPASWFLLWEGSDLLLFTSREINPELGFYGKMFASRENIHFKSY
ncbi:MAG: hypothetical protein A3F53_00205 [Candidatus Zambryskibacteria bacterium RIFCSPHIGHO2_12_FULL_48_10]|uniref:Uncharacterized protein n=1 Tax=Candidatus Zambryskibacteria bacterium RIFCSPHIGHO2_01_FULL_46_25 TaxID=1802738 RepID=A0A1G2T0L3_9BACT|nr:MAG: hypothetical protein A2838_03465 [Candidatus Zambryskibacteria bacterium RIFCSPHIGHO2_01_FULL_46_25]OHB00768.1 MAG: hypothetical protein A3F53_00205 [Candidatus Zambryskibacteria bacterium RIFCSPHIGHO2_12_FULL_48_10]OHB07103.1 MAG: hypothetical protein A3A31_00025 [Candidatus Zambryskibacteria bacterium RIFCSPLOWO2_01_FULL_48_25]